MPRTYKVAGFLLVTLLGVYGCARTPISAAGVDTAGATAKVQKLEADYRAAIDAREQFRQQLIAAQEQNAKAQGELRKELEQAKAAAATEKEVLKNEVKARTGERDALNAQYESFRKSLKELLGTADNSLSSLNLPSPKPGADQGARK
jgi:uncharacterized protein (DUF3084 family)